MTKSILISINPQHAINILQGKKTLELRKSVPNGFTGWVYMYVTKGKPRLSVVHDDENLQTYYYLNSTWGRSLNGDIVCRWWHDEYTYLRFNNNDKHKYWYELQAESYIPRSVDWLFNDLCLSSQQINDYGNGKDLYAWHIKQLEIFDKPMELGEFYREEYAVMPNGVFPSFQPLTKALSSWQYVWVKE